MERTERNEKDDAQKAKLIFISLAALVLILLVWSVAAGSKARSDRNAARQELEAVRADNVKLEQMVKDLNQENEGLKKKVAQLETRPKAKPAPKKKATASKGAAKKKTKGK